MRDWKVIFSYGKRICLRGMRLTFLPVTFGVSFKILSIRTRLFKGDSLIS